MTRHWPCLLLALCPLLGCPDEPPARAPAEAAPTPQVPAAESPQTPAAARLERSEALLAQGRKLDAVGSLFVAIGLAEAEPTVRAAAVRQLKALLGLAWHRRSAGELQVVGGELLLLREGSKLLRLDPGSGRVMWSFAPVGQRPRLPALLRAGALLVAIEPLAGVGPGRSARVLRLDPGSGEARARIDLPAGLAEPGLMLGPRGALCVRVSRPCCGPAGALELADDLAELPDPPDDCDPPEKKAAEPVPRLDLPFECGALAACAGDDRAAWLARLEDPGGDVRLAGDVAIVARAEGLYGVDLATCETLWRLPVRAWVRDAVREQVLFRLGPELFALHLERARELGGGKVRWWEPDAGALEVRVGAGREAPLRVGPTREARVVEEIADGAHLLFTAVSEARSLGQPFFRVFREPRVPEGEAGELWIWGGDAVPFDPDAAWTAPRCQALSYRVQRTVRDPNLGLAPPTPALPPVGGGGEGPPVPLRPEPRPGEGGLLIP